MKLPTDPKERNQIFVLIGIVAAGILAGLFYGFRSLSDGKTALKNRITELEEAQKKSDRKIKLMANDKRSNDAAISNIFAVAESHVLKAQYGNYNLVVRDMLEAQADELGLEIEPVTGLGETAVSRPSGEGVFKLYSARVTLNCSFHDLIRLLHKLESENQYLSISSIAVDQTRDNKDKRFTPRVSIDVQWPIWSDDAIEAELREQLKEDETPEGGGADS